MLNVRFESKKSRKKTYLFNYSTNPQGLFMLVNKLYSQLVCYMQHCFYSCKTLIIKKDIFFIFNIHLYFINESNV